MSEVALQIERIAAGSVAATENVIFETIVLSTGDIGYDAGTGVITFNEPGRYVIDWWVATQSSPSTNGAVFSLSSSQGDVLEGESPIKTGQVNGVGIIDVSAVPATVSLRNDSQGTVYYSVTVPVKATLVITLDSGVSAFGALLSDEGSIPLTETPVVVPMTVQSGAFMDIDYSVANAITMMETGIYRIDILVAGTTVVTESISLALAINGVPNDDMMQSMEFTAVNTTTFAMTNYLSLNMGDVLTLQMSSITATTFFFPPLGPGATLSVQRVF